MSQLKQREEINHSFLTLNSELSSNLPISSIIQCPAKFNTGIDTMSQKSSPVQFLAT